MYKDFGIYLRGGCRFWYFMFRKFVVPRMEASISILNVRTVYISQIIVSTCVSSRCHDPEVQNMDMKFGSNSTKKSYHNKLSPLTQLPHCKCYIVLM
jgi:hypothetical protein